MSVLTQRNPIVMHDAEAGATATGEVVQLRTDGPNLMVITVEPASGFDGTVSYVASLDGVTYFDVAGANTADQTLDNNDAAPAAAVSRQFDLSGWLYFKAPISARTAGNVTVKRWFTKPR